MITYQTEHVGRDKLKKGDRVDYWWSCRLFRTRFEVSNRRLASYFHSNSENCKCIVISIECSAAGNGRRTFFTNNSEETQTLSHNFVYVLSF